MEVDIDFYINNNGQWCHLKSDSLSRVPNIGEKVELFFEETNTLYIVVDIEHRIGRNSNVLLRVSKSLLNRR